MLGAPPQRECSLNHYGDLREVPPIKQRDIILREKPLRERSSSRGRYSQKKVPAVNYDASPFELPSLREYIDRLESRSGLQESGRAKIFQKTWFLKMWSHVFVEIVELVSL